MEIEVEIMKEKLSDESRNCVGCGEPALTEKGIGRIQDHYVWDWYSVCGKSECEEYALDQCIEEIRQTALNRVAIMAHERADDDRVFL